MLSAALPESRDVRTLVETFRQAALQIGYQHHAIVELSGASHPASIDVVSLHYPSEWVEHYTRNDYLSIPSIARHSATARRSRGTTSRRRTCASGIC